MAPSGGWRRRCRRRCGARILPDDPRGGYTRAVARAAATLAGEGATAMLCVPADVPLLTPGDVDRLVAEHESGADFVIVPAHDLVGTNAVLCAPPGRVALRFGGRSFDAHLQAARRAGTEACVLRLPRIELDLDRPADVVAFLRAPSDTHAADVLLRAGFVRAPPSGTGTPRTRRPAPRPA